MVLYLTMRNGQLMNQVIVSAVKNVGVCLPSMVWSSYSKWSKHSNSIVFFLEKIEINSM